MDLQIPSDGKSSFVPSAYTRQMIARAIELSLLCGQRFGDVVLGIRIDELRAGRFHVLQEKTKKTVSYSTNLFPGFDGWIAKTLEHCHPDAVTVVHAANGRPFRKEGVRTHWSRCRRGAAYYYRCLGKDDLADEIQALSWHGLRVTFARQMMELNPRLDERDLQQLMGHSSVEMTRGYLHEVQDMLVARQLDQIQNIERNVLDRSLGC